MNFRVRVAGLAPTGGTRPARSRSGWEDLPKKCSRSLSQKFTSLSAAQYECWSDEIVPALCEKNRIRVLSLAELGTAAREFIENFYTKSVEPLLTPVTVDPAHPFPHVLNKALCVLLSC